MEFALRYIPNPKHKEPWQRGKKGSLCPSWSHDKAESMLSASIPHPQSNKKARFATSNGMAFAAYPDSQGGWHGFPIGWNEVPDTIRNIWLREKRVSRNEIRKFEFLKTDENGRLLDTP
ncbi:MAG: hypothetical protein HQM01_09365 [Magnetococcales bacterium]|nr:hypothetical protein [Magnetococcales bacterium]